MPERPACRPPGGSIIAAARLLRWKPFSPPIAKVRDLVWLVGMCVLLTWFCRLLSGSWMLRANQSTQV